MTLILKFWILSVCEVLNILLSLGPNPAHEAANQRLLPYENETESISMLKVEDCLNSSENELVPILILF